ncbi:uncharacterized protein K489DRAFT_369778 [Dissoconium aciculare CBS 342.82]|uniref:Uncharacterized protein n=1 Tax=Dissoconium aciculare CBS 342.82 TaxID=1314786 RepID=A0A6J3M794_9PEZI|nr:uncharacterized protein K489DRAFT_369778 [Dissoconium aciculare CBS 342.82]KAF1823409.1 hypothetical protein K489DRAFT_369778 [Dissoconium aciculare CBS 342.82]
MRRAERELVVLVVLVLVAAVMVVVVVVVVVLMEMCGFAVHNDCRRTTGATLMKWGEKDWAVKCRTAEVTRMVVLLDSRRRNDDRNTMAHVRTGLQLAHILPIAHLHVEDSKRSE